MVEWMTMMQRENQRQDALGKRFGVGSEMADDVVWITYPCGIGDEDSRHLTMNLDGRGDGVTCPACGQTYRATSEITVWVIVEEGPQADEEEWVRAY